MQNALVFILRTLAELYIITFVLRFILQWVRADVRNPLCQFIIRVTNPLILPIRRFVPPIGPIDSATLLVLVGLQYLITLVLVTIACVGTPDILQLLLVAVLRLVYVTLQIYFFAILAYVILSWVSPGGYNPAISLLTSVVEPLLQPLRRWIPAIGGLDLSPLFAIIGIQALMMLLPAGPVMSGLACSSIGRLI